MIKSKVSLHASGRAVTNRTFDDSRTKNLTEGDLENLGLDFRAIDSAWTGPGPAASGMPGHMLETWMPGVLRVISQARNIDDIAGVSTVGKFEDETIHFRTSEPTGKAEFYGDNANIPLADYNPGEEKRAVVRFEQGFKVDHLEQLRQQAYQFQAATEKRNAAIESLDASRNLVGFNGVSGMTTYGILNDPNLPAYMSYADATVGGQQPWLTTGTFASVTKDITRMVTAIETQMGGNLNDNAPMVMVMPTGYRGILNLRESGTGVSVRDWMDTTYPNIRYVYTPNFKAAYTAKDVVYLFVESAGVYDNSDIQGASVIQAVPVRYQVLGSKQDIKSYIEDAVNATAGVIVLRPWAFARYVVSA